MQGDVRGSWGSLAAGRMSAIVLTVPAMLSRQEAEAVYDRIGRWQDTQAVYERAAIDALIAHGAFDTVTTLFEIGCGTGRVADRLLREHCPAEARYVGVDLSTAMVQAAQNRLDGYGGRATIRKTDGSFAFELPPASQERVVATYVFDLLAPADIQACLAEARRVLTPGGRLCLAGLTWGRRPLGRLVSTGWSVLHRVRSEWVGGCRPLRLRSVLEEAQWTVTARTEVQSWGVPSEAVVATPA